MELIESSNYITKTHLDEMNSAIDENPQVAYAWGVTERMKSIESRLGS